MHVVNATISVHFIKLNTKYNGCFWWGVLFTEKLQKTKVEGHIFMKYTPEPWFTNCCLNEIENHGLIFCWKYHTCMHGCWIDLISYVLIDCALRSYLSCRALIPTFMAISYEYTVEMTYPIPEGMSAAVLNAFSQVDLSSHTCPLKKKKITYILCRFIEFPIPIPCRFWALW